jgi:hypothetical protein
MQTTSKQISMQFELNFLVSGMKHSVQSQLSDNVNFSSHVVATGYFHSKLATPHGNERNVTICQLILSDSIFRT